MKQKIWSIMRNRIAMSFFLFWFIIAQSDGIENNRGANTSKIVYASTPPISVSSLPELWLMSISGERWWKTSENCWKKWGVYYLNVLNSWWSPIQKQMIFKDYILFCYDCFENKLITSTNFSVYKMYKMGANIS